MPHPIRFILLLALVVSPSVRMMAGEGQEQALTFIHMTDIHLRGEHDAVNRFKQVVQDVRTRHPEASFLVNTGDTLDGAKGRWEHWEESLKLMKGLPVRALLGNHDAEAGLKDAGLYARLGMPDRYYAFDHGRWRFLMLDGNTLDKDEVQMEWLKKALEGCDRDRHVVVCSHQCIVSAGASVHLPGDLLKTRKALVELFRKHPQVRLCLSGHTHIHDLNHLHGILFANGGAVSGRWWERGEDGKNDYQGTPPGYGVVRLHPDGRCTYDYMPHGR